MDSRMSGTRITVPPLEIDLYKKGFDGVCKLDRKADGKKLSDLVERISEPLVIALDAPWGAGKSVFLQCWVGEHLKSEHGHKANTIYFDAFKHDFLDDPLIALTGAISERFDKGGTKSQTWKKAKNAAFKLVRPAVRVAGAVATAGATEVAGALFDAAIEAGSKELQEASENFWAKEDGKRAAMQAFRAALKDIAKDQKLVIVVDELDRCRPDYALNLLEVIKHFFDVENVHFVLGVNLKELENSVKARYGSGVDAGTYLQKFITAKMPLNQTDQYGRNDKYVQHLDQLAAQLDLRKNRTFYFVKDVLRMHPPNSISLRTMEKIATLLAISNTYGNPNRDTEALYILRACLVIIKEVEPGLYRKILNQRADFAAIAYFFNIAVDPLKIAFDGSIIIAAPLAWAFDCLPAVQNFRIKGPHHRDPCGEVIIDVKPKDALRTLALRELEVFQLLS